MNCLECQELLQRRLDGERVSASADLELHLASCQKCRLHQAGAGLLLDGLKALPRIEPPADFADQIVASILHDRVRRRLRMRRRVWLTAGLAAAILVMAWAGNLWLPNHRPENAPQHIVENKDTKETKTPAPDESPTPLGQAVDEARDAVLALTERVAGETKEQAKLFIAAAPTDVSGLTEKVRNMGDPPMQEPLDPAAQSLRQAGQGVSQGFQTVAGNARRAVDFFYNELPVLDGP